MVSLPIFYPLFGQSTGPYVTVFALTDRYARARRWAGLGRERTIIMPTPKAHSPEQTYSHFIMVDQWDRELLFTCDGDNYRRKLMNPALKTPPQLIDRTLSRMVYGGCWLSYCEQRAAGNEYPTTWTSPDEYNPAQQDLDEYFGEHPRVMEMKP